ncbi:antibiotic biosynthesis monooxygenase [Alteromonadaceae bacterium M269]|nr:antibiotic biosynthesis monooxygenase [Alteromonadaceae bacterium M269]
MPLIAETPKAPYYAVIFTSLRTEVDEGYGDTALRMLELAEEQPGYLGYESARDGVGITISYWSDLDAIKSWKKQAEHREAQRLGREKWYSAFTIRIAKVERAYSL